jgi:putative effector of murein hydrolase
MKPTRDVASMLRRDATYIGNAVVAVIFVGFAGLAIAAAVIDVLGITRQLTAAADTGAAAH